MKDLEMALAVDAAAASAAAECLSLSFAMAGPGRTAARFFAAKSCGLDGEKVVGEGEEGEAPMPPSPSSPKGSPSAIPAALAGKGDEEEEEEEEEKAEEAEGAEAEAEEVESLSLSLRVTFAVSSRRLRTRNSPEKGGLPTHSIFFPTSLPDRNTVSTQSSARCWVSVISDTSVLGLGRLAICLVHQRP
jgi:hypothetical protein